MFSKSTIYINLLYRYAFVEYSTAEEADDAVLKTNGYKLDKRHIFRVTHFDDFKKYDEVPEEYVKPEIKPYEPRVCCAI
jgi:translation initiation factor 3 subunit B